MALFSQPYRRPPITEAVVEFRLRDQLGQDRVERLARLAGRRFFYQEDELVHRIDINGMSANVTQDPIGKKLSSLDRTDILLIRPTGLTMSRLAPYPGWDHFIASAEIGWSELRATID